MSLIAVVALSLFVAVAVLVWMLHKGKYKVSEVAVKTPFIEAKLTPPQPTASPEASKERTEVLQNVSDGGEIVASPINAPANSGATIGQHAVRNGKISDSNITLR